MSSNRKMRSRLHEKDKMIGLDLDGTLLNSKKEVTDHTKSVLEEAIATGDHCAGSDRAAAYRYSRTGKSDTGNAVCADDQWGENLRFDP